MNRDSVFATRVNKQERQALNRLAQLESRTPSEMLRELVRAEAKRRGVWDEGEVADDAKG